MIIIRLKGGLGNQLFQYASARALAEHHGVPLRLDVTWYGSHENQGVDRRTFDLHALNITEVCASDEELALFGGSGATARKISINKWLRKVVGGHRVWRCDDMGFLPQLRQLGSKLYMEGYYQHPEHFSEISDALRSDCVLASRMDDFKHRLAQRLSGENSVCIQVRRTDYVSDPAKASVHNLLDHDYYRRAWNLIRAGGYTVKGYVFTDDQDWARNYFENWAGVEVIPAELDGPSYIHRFELMRSCRHFIIMNSTWGWWAAWLGAKADSRVIMPREWFRGRLTSALGLQCPSWEIA